LLNSSGCGIGMAEVFAKYRHGNKDFEIIVDLDKAMDFKQGKNVDIKEVLMIDAIYADVKKGLHANSSDIQQVFKTNNVYEVAAQIIRRGTVQLTADYRKNLRDVKVKQIVDFLSKNCINPQTNLPHPPQRIENALEEAKVKIDEFKSAEEQLNDVLKEMQKVLPIKIETTRVAVKIPAIYTGRAYTLIKGYTESEEWQPNGDLICVLELPAGFQIEFFNKLNSLTHGSAETRDLK
jgi:ribosome maturation protein SDO1